MIKYRLYKQTIELYMIQCQIKNCNIVSYEHMINIFINYLGIIWPYHPTWPTNSILLRSDTENNRNMEGNDGN
jgi:hypothetical protein